MGFSSVAKETFSTVPKSIQAENSNKDRTASLYILFEANIVIVELAKLDRFVMTNKEN